MWELAGIPVWDILHKYDDGKLLEHVKNMRDYLSL